MNSTKMALESVSAKELLDYLLNEHSQFDKKIDEIKEVKVFLGNKFANNLDDPTYRTTLRNLTLDIQLLNESKKSTSNLISKLTSIAEDLYKSRTISI